MKKLRLVLAAAVLMVCAGTALAGPSSPLEKPKTVQGAGCVQAGVENQCLVLKDAKSGKLYNVFFKGERPRIGLGIVFSGVLRDGPTTCMQGAPVAVTSWTRDASLKCSQDDAPVN